MIPHQAECFQQRGTADALKTNGSRTPAPYQVLTGMGGVGKTQLAADHAHQACQSGAVDLLVWITAADRSSIIATYSRTAARVEATQSNDAEQAAKDLLAWLQTTERRWLIVLDDLADPADLRGLWPPANPGGRTLITTRRRDAALTGPDRHLLDVDLFTEKEATAYLATQLAAHHRHDDPAQITALADDLGRLPLALAQAAAYLIDLQLDCAAYRTQLADRTLTLPDLLPEDSGLPDDQAHTVAAAWALSLDRADRLRPEGIARPMLRLASMLDPNGIPAIVLTSSPALAYLTEHRTRHPSGATVSQDDARTALACLHRLSLATYSPDTPHQALRVHQLIQRTAREALTEDQRDRLAITAADALLEEWPDIERDTALAQALRANTDAVIRHAHDALWQPDGHAVLFYSGESLGASGQVTAATSYYQDLVKNAHARLGPDHPDTLTARAGLARWRGEAGDAAGAAAASAELLPDLERELGPEDTITLFTQDNLAQYQGEAGDAAGAATAYEHLLEQDLRVLGTDHPDTLTARGNLARWRGEAGDAAGAAAALAELLPDLERVLGPDNPSTLTARILLT
ncbi:NB-ARC domain-containing protein, partial [Kitasatospora cinereorecta]|uniref:NB-ARC domain-containing protein n=1 Tax=Kitasatospora cinereorecta TaxID=285560 RepID=UPI0031F86D4C